MNLTCRSVALVQEAYLVQPGWTTRWRPINPVFPPPASRNPSCGGVFASRWSMGENYLLGLAWILAAGVTQGSFALPMKFVRRWKWEHVWLVYSLVAFLVLPLLIALLTVPSLGRVYAQAAPEVIFLTALFGAAWGVGSIFFGLGVDALGMALGFSIMTGIYTALGALIPLLVLTPDVIWTQNGYFIMAGNGVTIAGVVISAIAGDLRERQQGERVITAALNKKVPFVTGMAICLASGILSAAFNFSYAFGKPIADVAQKYGASPQNGLNALWLIALSSGGVLNIGYCLYLLKRRRSWRLLWGQGSVVDWIGALAMSVLWTGSVIIYGWGAGYMGRLGPSLGWSLWNAFLMITTVACGLFTREWEGADGRALRLLFVGIGVLIFASVLLGLGGAGS
jgi:L-rhamnose-H+ transport protein